MRELALAFRRLRQSPTFTVAAVASLALGIGANSAMFGLAEALLLRPLPVHAPEQLVQIGSAGSTDREPDALAGSVVDALRRAGVFDGLCSFEVPLATVDVSGRLETVSGVVASGDCFQTLGVHAMLGRLPGPADDHAAAPKVVAISYDSWHDDFGGRPDVIGRSIGVDGVGFTIIGVVERSFPGLLVGFPARVYVPIHQIALPGGLTYATLGQVTFARLHGGQTPAQAEARLAARWPAWMKASIPSTLNATERADYLQRRPIVTSAQYGLDYWLRGRFGRPLMLLVALGSLVLLVAAVNVGNLLLARAAHRRRETAVRLALGATRWQIARQVLLESAVVLTASVMAGMFVASWCEQLLLGIFRASSPTFLLDVSPDGRVVAFSFATAVLVFLAFAIAPALRSRDLDISDVQRMSRRTTGADTRAQNAAVIAQVALTIVLVATADVLVSGLQSVRNMPTGVDLPHVLQLQLAPTPGGYVHDAGPASYYAGLLDRVKALPGVTGAGLAADVAFNSQARETAVRLIGMTPVPAEEQIVTDGFFSAMGIPLLDGTDFSREERSPGSVIVSESLAKRLNGPRSPVGLAIQIGTGSRLRTATIVGVARDAVLTDPDTPSTAIVYDNWWGGPILFPNLIVRTTTSDPAAAAQTIRTAVQGKHREFVSRVRTLQGTFDASLTQQFLLASLSGAFGLFGLLLAGVGLYGLLTFTVAQRKNEIGVRLALGATPTRVLQNVAGRSVRIVAAGVALGAPFAWIAARAASSVTPGAEVNTFVSLGSGGVLLILAAVAATAPPALRASSVDPLEALRHE